MLPKNGLEDAIDACWQAHQSCERTLYGHCLEMGGDHVAPEHVELMTSCIQICQIAADFMTRSSPLHTSVCAACANVCEACADSCEALIPGDVTSPEMQQCADACRIAAKACRATGQETFPVPPQTLEQRFRA